MMVGSEVCPAVSVRSFLFTPGDKVDRMRKALDSCADAVIFDLEDAVDADFKVVSRECVRSMLKNAGGCKPIVVRINGLDTGLAVHDLAAVVSARPWAVMLPKSHGSRDLEILANYLDALEAREGIPVGATRIIFIATETAAATLALGSLPERLSVGARARLWGALWGSEDLAASLGAAGNRDSLGSYTFSFQAARSQCLHVCRALDIHAIDAVWTDIADSEGLEREAADGLRDGFDAKAAIHPAQLPIINAVMTPTDQDVEWARQVVAALSDRAVARIGSQMVDLVHKRRAEKVLARTAAFSIPKA